ncbi:MAG: CvpA family protein [Bacteroidota bacterium]
MILDILTALVIFFCFWFGFTKGVIKAFLTIVGLLCGFFAALKYTPVMTQFLRDSFGEYSNLMPVAGFLILFIGTFLLFKLLGQIVEGFFKKIDINLINKLAGGALFAGVGLILFSALVYFVDGAGLLSEKVKVASRLYPYLEGLPEKSATLVKFIFPIVKEWIENLWAMFK